jgi:hypothetical protein
MLLLLLLLLLPVLVVAALRLCPPLSLRLACTALSLWQHLALTRVLLLLIDGLLIVLLLLLLLLLLHLGLRGLGQLRRLLARCCTLAADDIKLILMRV